VLGATDDRNRKNDKLNNGVQGELKYDGNEPLKRNAA